MADKLAMRELSTEERAALERLAHSRTAQARRGERARVVLEALGGASGDTIAARVHLRRNLVYRWLGGCNAQGLSGLDDHPRSGRPPTYTPEPGATVIATALTDPQTLGQAESSWTLDRLVASRAEQEGSRMKRSRLDEVLAEEGLRWRKQETWFGAKVDPAVAEKRGPSSSSTPRHRRGVAS